MNLFAQGGRIIFYPHMDIAALGKIRHTERPSYLVTRPTGFRMIMNARGFDPGNLDHTRLIVCGGATTSMNILEAGNRSAARSSGVRANGNLRHHHVNRCRLFYRQAG